MSTCRRASPLEVVRWARRDRARRVLSGVTLVVHHRFKNPVTLVSGDELVTEVTITIA